MQCGFAVLCPRDGLNNFGRVREGHTLSLRMATIEYVQDQIGTRRVEIVAAAVLQYKAIQVAAQLTLEVPELIFKSHIRPAPYSLLLSRAAPQPRGPSPQTL